MLSQEDANAAHVSIDIETLSLRNDAIVLSIGACQFDPLGRDMTLQSPFYKPIFIDSCLRSGLVLDSGSLEWWMKQSDKAREVFTTDLRTELAFALVDLCRWFSYLRGYDKAHTGDTRHRGPYVWANGDSFDIAVLKSAYDKCAPKLSDPIPPWPYNAPRDLRTLCMVAGVNAKAWMATARQPHEEMHNALADAAVQARCIRHAFDIWLSESNGRVR